MNCIYLGNKQIKTNILCYISKQPIYQQEFVNHCNLIDDNVDTKRDCLTCRRYTPRQRGNN